MPSDQAQRDSCTLRRQRFQLLKTVVCKHRGFESHSLRSTAAMIETIDALINERILSSMSGTLGSWISGDPSKP